MQKVKYYDLDFNDLGIEVIQKKEAEFYTTDTEAILCFKITDDTNIISCTLSFFNIFDGSSYQVTADIDSNLITAELPSEFIKHAGSYEGQIVFENETDAFTSGNFIFEIHPHLLDDKQIYLERLDIFSELETKLTNYVDFKIAEVSGIDPTNFVTFKDLEDYSTKKYVDDSGIDLLGIYNIAKL